MTTPLQLHKVVACDSCRKNPCQNNGVCSPSSTKYGLTCDCPHTFTGVYCKEHVERCYSGACGNHGICVNGKGNGFICKCNLGRHGKQCEKGKF